MSKRLEKSQCINGYYFLVLQIHTFSTKFIFTSYKYMLGKGLELLSANGGRFETNKLLLADDTALVADSEEKLYRLVNEFGRVCERRK